MYWVFSFYVCGLAGFSFSHPFSDSVKWLQDACEHLSHRGPDGCGYYVDKSSRIGLAHTRLSIQDLSDSGHQPMHSPDQTVCLVFNGEIYNFRELRDDLIELGFSFLVILIPRFFLISIYLFVMNIILLLPSDALKSLLKRLNGIFAFALWDARFNSLLLVRDSFGVKPLYIKTSVEGLSFASESKVFDSSESYLDARALHRYSTFLLASG